MNGSGGEARQATGNILEIQYFSKQVKPQIKHALLFLNIFWFCRVELKRVNIPQ